jgi:hypothetical protein
MEDVAVYVVSDRKANCLLPPRISRENFSKYDSTALKFRKAVGLILQPH